MNKSFGYGLGIVVFAVLIGVELRRQGATVQAAVALSITLFASLMTLYFSNI